MPSVSVDLSVRGVGATITNSSTRSADGGQTYEITVAAGKTGTLSTRTDNETGTLTMAGGHGLMTGDTIDLFWDGGARYGIKVGTVSVNSVPIGADNVGVGDVLPIATTAIVAHPRTPFASLQIVGDSLTLLSIQNYNTLGTGGCATLLDENSTLIMTIGLLDSTPFVFDGSGVNLFDSGSSLVNPFAGTTPVASMALSNASSTTASTFNIIVIQDATP